MSKTSQCIWKLKLESKSKKEEKEKAFMHVKVKIRKKKITNLAMHVKAPSSRSDIRCNLDFFQISRFQRGGGYMKEKCLK